MKARVLALALALALASGALAAPTSAGAAEVAGTTSFLGVRLNGADVSSGTEVLERGAGHVFVLLTLLQSLRIEVDPSLAETIDGERYVALEKIVGVSFTIDRRSQRLDLLVAPSLFPPTSFSENAATQQGQILGVGAAFLNYRASGTSVRGGSNTDTLVTGGIAGPGGVLSTSAEYGNIVSAMGTAIRLDTAFQHDVTSRDRAVRIGDSFSESGRLGSSLRFAGIQYASDFDIDPNLVTSPEFHIGGEAQTPSTVDIYVNGRVSQQPLRVPAGPFTINSLPLLDGSGHVSLVVTDSFGQQRIINRNFYVASKLLRERLSEFDLSAGARRINYGVTSFEYGAPFVSGTLRHGYTNQFTGETHFEADRGAQVASFVASFSANGLGVFEGGLAANTGRSAGERALLGYVYQSNMGFSVESELQTSTRGFRTISGESFGGVEGLIDVIQPLGRFQSVSVAYAQESGNLVTARTASAGYSLRRSGTVLDLSVTRSFDGRSAAFAVTLRRRFGDREDAGVSATLGDRSRIGANASYTVSGPRSGYSSNVLAYAGRSGPLDAAFSGYNEHGSGTAEVLSSGGTVASTLTLEGGFALVGGRLYVTRDLNDGFGVVVIDGGPGVRVLENGLDIGRTDARGTVFLPDLRAYAQNTVTLQQNDIPIDAEVDRASRTVTPFAHGAAILRFRLRHTNAVTFHVVDEAGLPLPSGTLLTPAGGAAVPVGSAGFAYVANLAAGPIRIAASVDGRPCTFEIIVKRPGGLPSDLGTVTCASGTRTKP